MSELAILGGQPVLKSPLASYNSIGEAEIKSVIRVMRSGKLSGFYGSPGDEYWGGPEVQVFERAWADRFQAKHAVSANSATSGLYAAVGAIGIGPGDEVIVPPYTMSATVMAPIIYGAVPVFADIEEVTFGLDPEAVRKAITPKTKAIIAVNLFGHPARLDELLTIAEDNGLILVEDNAQSPLAEDNGRFAGTIGHIGVFSLNFHKHIHTGEGGICVTNNDNLAMRLKLIRNHAENVVEQYDIEDLTNMVGFNFRLTEIQAAIGIEQLKKIDMHIGKREALAQALTDGVKDLEGLVAPKVRAGCRHVYYVWAVRLNEKAVGISRKTYCKALNAEGFPLFEGYVKPLYFLPVFQKKIAFGKNGFPFSISPGVNYEKGICPVCERMYDKEFVGFEACSYYVDEMQTELLIEAFKKVHAHVDELRVLENSVDNIRGS
jgi:perosamine synthetase